MMSTRVTILYDEIGEVHIYQEMATGEIRIEKEANGMLLYDVLLMKAVRWNRIRWNLINGRNTNISLYGIMPEAD